MLVLTYSQYWAIVAETKKRVADDRDIHQQHGQQIRNTSKSSYLYLDKTGSLGYGNFACG